MSRNIGIAGAGRIGQALGRLLRERGNRVSTIAGRDPERTRAAAEFVGTSAVRYAELPGYADHVLIAVPDDAIESVTTTLAEAGMRGDVALHTCGARGPEALTRLAVQGVSCGSIHPLQTVASPAQGVAALPGSAFAITAEGAAAAFAGEIVASIGGMPLKIEAAQRPLYHAAAVMASNYILALLDSAVILMKEAGIAEDQALRALAPLVRASVENAVHQGPAGALTGPIERGDAGTIVSHLAAMKETPESVQALYRAAGLHAIQMAMRKSPGADRRKMEQLLRKHIDDK